MANHNSNTSTNLRFYLWAIAIGIAICIGVVSILVVRTNQQESVATVEAISDEPRTQPTSLAQSRIASRPTSRTLINDEAIPQNEWDERYVARWQARQSAMVRYWSILDKLNLDHALRDSIETRLISFEHQRMTAEERNKLGELTKQEFDSIASTSSSQKLHQLLGDLLPYVQIEQFTSLVRQSTLGDQRNNFENMIKVRFPNLNDDNRLKVTEAFLAEMRLTTITIDSGSNNTNQDRLFRLQKVADNVRVRLLGSMSQEQLQIVDEILKEHIAVVEMQYNNLR